MVRVCTVVTLFALRNVAGDLLRNWQNPAGRNNIMPRVIQRTRAHRCLLSCDYVYLCNIHVGVSWLSWSGDKQKTEPEKSLERDVLLRWPCGLCVSCGVCMFNWDYEQHSHSCFWVKQILTACKMSQNHEMRGKKSITCREIKQEHQTGRKGNGDACWALRNCLQNWYEEFFSTLFFSSLHETSVMGTSHKQCSHINFKGSFLRTILPKLIIKDKKEEKNRIWKQRDLEKELVF